ncbi:MAG: hypothetical protein ACFFB0_13330 [Promethearchaeota archaeon]
MKIIKPYRMSNKGKRKSKKGKIIIQQGVKQSSQDFNLKKEDNSVEVFPCMRKEINSWDRHMMLIFNFSRRM